MSPTTSRRYAVALSFPGEHRSFVEKVAYELRAAFGGESQGQGRVFYDKWHEASIIGYAADHRLQKAYAEADLIVPFFCRDYLRKNWCGVERRVVDELVFRREFDRVLPFRFDDATVDGSLDTDLIISVDDRTPENIARLILDRYTQLKPRKRPRATRRLGNEAPAVRSRDATADASTEVAADLLERFNTDFVPAERIEELRAFAVRLMGASIAPVDVLRSWHAVNPRIFHSVDEVEQREFTTTSKLVGYYSLRPISQEAIKALDRCYIDGAGLRPEHILPPDIVPPAVYVGGVAGVGRLAQAAVVFHLKSKAREYRLQGVRVFYTKPITADGERLVRNFGFMPLNCPDAESKHVYRLVFP